MTVKELITKLLDYNMHCEVVATVAEIGPDERETTIALDLVMEETEETE